MKEIPLTHGLTTKVSDEDYVHLSKESWSAYRIAGTSHTGKVYIYGYKAGHKISGKRYWIHNVIMNPQTDMEVDHIDGDPLNNQRENLRIVSKHQNRMNRGKPSGTKTSAHKGVCFDKTHHKFRATITHNGVQLFLGYYQNEQEASEVYDAKSHELFGEFARSRK